MTKNGTLSGMSLSTFLLADELANVVNCVAVDRDWYRTRYISLEDLAA